MIRIKLTISCNISLYLNDNISTNKKIGAIRKWIWVLKIWDILLYRGLIWPYGFKWIIHMCPRFWEMTSKLDNLLELGHSRDSATMVWTWSFEWLKKQNRTIPSINIPIQIYSCWWFTPMIDKNKFILSFNFSLHATCYFCINKKLLPKEIDLILQTLR